MTKLHDIELPDEVVEILQEFITEASDDDVLNYAQYGNKALLNGLRPTKDNAGRVKERFVKRLGAGKKISKNDAGFLTRHNPYSFFDGLEMQTIITNLDGLCASIGSPKVEAALALSGRSELQELVGKLISGEHAIKEIKPEDARGFAYHTFQSYLPFMLELQKIFDDDSEEKPEKESQQESAVDDATQSKAEEACARLKEQLAQIKKDLKGYKKEASRAQELDKKLSRAEKKRTELSEAVNDLKEQLASAKKELARLYAAITSQVDEELESSLRGWLRGPNEVQEEVARASGSDLLDRASHLVEKQQEIDCHSGNRSVLSRRLRDANDARTQLATLSRESLNPLPELAGMISDLDREIERLRQLLNKGSDVSAFAQNFMTKIGQADSPNAVVEYKRVLESIKEAGVLEREDARVLFEYCDKRMDLAYDKYVPAVKDSAPVRDPFRRLKESIYKNQEMIWFLDGHNILFDLVDMFGTFGTDGKPTETSRHKLSEALIALVSNADQCQVRLYYDSPEHSEYSPVANVKVIYSGGTGDHRADDAICADMEYLCGKASSVPFFITTDDRDLRKQAAQLSSIALDVDDLYALLRTLGLKNA